MALSKDALENTSEFVKGASSAHDDDVNLSALSTDERDMLRMGKLQQTRRNFGLLPLLGFTTIMLNSWESVFPFFLVTGFLNGGGPTLIYGYIFCFFGSLTMCASISEMASMYPTSGGQYHWAALLAPPKWSKFLSWLTGWVSVLGWQAGCASGTFLGGTIIQGLLVLNNPSYEYQRWHGTLILYAVLLVSVFVNTVAIRILPALEGIILILHVLGFLAILIPLVHLAPQSPAQFVFATWSNGSGYDDGLSWFVGLLTSSVLFIGFDGACHMAEEVKDASINVPRSMFFTIFLNGALGFAMIIAILFCIGDVDNALATPTGYPFIEIFRNATQSTAGATAMTSILIALIIFATFGYVASASRQLWAFARDQGLPFSNVIAKVDGRWAIPLWSIALTALINSLLALINIGSTVAFNAIVSLVVAGLFSSYVITISLMIRKRLTGEDIPFGPWNMGRCGLVVNVYALLYTIIVTFFSFFPPATPVTAMTMNWSCVVYGGTVIFGLIFWVTRGRHQWQGPLMDRHFAEQA
ncbi:putative amino acid permease [Lindgomyces ingoldianus]|uniref:Amino acid permease n=1 Tax=Lindgomyces ingoldianus TaxID=673940 RepID=A0ACB6QY51_9PLEO|nr:putative amino acid permease [Lindgomyces ingoldianus]KAF2471005.1 putative amino acid permease [Lindgomyces ingoldianus]